MNRRQPKPQTLSRRDLIQMASAGIGCLSKPSEDAVVEDKFRALYRNNTVLLSRLNRIFFELLLICWPVIVAASEPQSRPPQDQPVVDSSGAIHLPPIVVPLSKFLSPQARVGFMDLVNRDKKLDDDTNSSITKEMSESKQIEIIRQILDQALAPAIRQAEKLYPTNRSRKIIGGVTTDVYVPKNGITRRNERRVLINLHQGGFMVGARTYAALESIPLASVGRIKVISVDYREGPEYKFPAATEDVIAVYRALLKQYKPSEIGIYGCSAGGVLTAEAAAWMIAHNIPLPGAIGVFCASAAGWIGGDSSVVGLALRGKRLDPEYASTSERSVLLGTTYFRDADFKSPLVLPIRSEAILRKFPPTLIVTSTRDQALSSAVYTHSQLVKLGVEAELHVWEGLGHGFFAELPNVPESREVWNVVARFFDKHLQQ